MRFRLLGVSVVCTIAFGVVSGCSQSSPRLEASQDPGTTASTTQAIQGGSDDGAAHPYAVGVCAGQKGNCQGFCSGALILPNVVATARHCVNQTPKMIDCEAKPAIRFGADEGVNWITTNNKMNQTSLGWHSVKQVYVPTDDRVCGHDLALLILNDVIPASEAKPVIPGVQYAMGDIDRYLPSFTAIGFGNTSPQGFTAGTRRIREGINILCIPGDEFIGCPPAAKVNDNEFVGGDGTCEGDSGSSPFETRSFNKDQPVSFGVLSRGGKSDDGLTCVQSVYTRFDKWRDLVIKTAELASANWTLYPKPVPDWTIFVPPPADAGPPEAGPPKKLGDGFACNDNAQCKSEVCADTGAGKACTLPCVEGADDQCFAGFVCKEKVCVIDVGGAPPPAATTSSATTSGCSVPATGSGPAGWGALGMTSAVGLVLGMRRRSERKKRGNSDHLRK